MTEVERVLAILTSIENGEHATKGRDFGRGMAYAATLIRGALNPSDRSAAEQGTATSTPGADHDRSARPDERPLPDMR